jgi:hypothetical protein
MIHPLRYVWSGSELVWTNLIPSNPEQHDPSYVKQCCMPCRVTLHGQLENILVSVSEIKKLIAHSLFVKLMASLQNQVQYLLYHISQKQLN